jgi:hypothetical protein
LHGLHESCIWLAFRGCFFGFGFGHRG